jgi:hypothetical protein
MPPYIFCSLEDILRNQALSAWYKTDTYIIDLTDKYCIIQLTYDNMTKSDTIPIDEYNGIVTWFSNLLQCIEEDRMLS